MEDRPALVEEQVDAELDPALGDPAKGAEVVERDVVYDERVVETQRTGRVWRIMGALKGRPQCGGLNAFELLSGRGKCQAGRYTAGTNGGMSVDVQASQKPS